MRDVDRAAGDLDFDPLGLRPDRFIPDGDKTILSGAASMKTMQTRELNHGRKRDQHEPNPRLARSHVLQRLPLPLHASRPHWRRDIWSLLILGMRAHRPRDDRNQLHGRSGADHERKALLNSNQ